MLNINTLNKWSANTIFFLLSLSLAGDLFIGAIPSKIFYFTFYVSVLTLILNIRSIPFKEVKNNLSDLIFPASILMLALSKMIWASTYYSDAQQDIVNNYYHSGKFLICSLFIYLALLKNRIYLTQLCLSLSLSASSFLIMVSIYFGIKEFHSAERIKLVADAATTAAYIMVLQAIIIIYMAKKIIGNVGLRLITILFLYASFAILITMTGTRAALFVYLLIMTVTFLPEIKNVKMKYMPVLFLILITISGFMIYKSYSRITDIKTDIISLEKRDDNTSLGARFTMTEAGIHAIKASFFGQSVEERLIKAESYIKGKDPKSTLSLFSIKYHFHNEVIESLSLQGIFGFSSLLFFYFSGIKESLAKSKKTNTCLLMIIISLILMGITDVLFIQRNTTMVISICLILESQMRFNFNKRILTPPAFISEIGENTPTH